MKFRKPMSREDCWTKWGKYSLISGKFRLSPQEENKQYNYFANNVITIENIFPSIYIFAFKGNIRRLVENCNRVPYRARDEKRCTPGVSLKALNNDNS